MTKHDLLLSLARRRQRTRWPGYTSLADYHGGAYEAELVSPYTKSAANVDSPIMILLQDWVSADRLSGPFDPDLQRLGRIPNLPTNRNLEALLARHFDRHLDEVYATNLFPFIKPGSMTASIAHSDLVRAAREFAIPQAEIINPELLICFGKSCFNAVRLAWGHSPPATLDDAIGRPFSVGTIRVWCQSHPGAVGRNMRNRGGIDRVNSDWARMAAEFATTNQRRGKRSV